MPQCAAANAVQLLLVPSLLLCGSLCGLLLLPRGVQGAITWNGDWAHGCDFAGQDLSNAQVPADQCGPRCTETRGCTHYTWTQWNGGTCWLKSGPVSRNDAKPSGDDVLCGVSPDWNGNMWAFACDFKGGDMGSAQVGPAEQCGPRCSSTAGCTHFTWTPYNGGTCFFKSGNVGRADALTTGDNSMICGIVDTIPPPPPGTRQIIVKNQCASPIWMASGPNNNHQPLPDSLVSLGPQQTHTYNIPAGGWAGRFWPKTGCNPAGTMCDFGDSSPPCPPQGCQPPADTKVEFLFPGLGSRDASWYDVSLVDGYSLPMKIVPMGVSSGSCIATTCALSLDACPTDEINGLGDLRVRKNGRTVACLSPCKRWNYPAPYGYGRNEHDQPGVMMCCPTPPVSAQQCSAGPVIATKYVRLLRQSCPTAYSYAYDDLHALHNCPSSTSFYVTVCP